MNFPNYSGPLAAGDRSARASWSKEFSATLTLAWPLVLSQLATVAMSTTDVIMMGWLGPLELAAGTLGSSIVFPFVFFGLGLLTSVAAMCARKNITGSSPCPRRCTA